MNTEIMFKLAERLESHLEKEFEELKEFPCESPIDFQSLKTMIIGFLCLCLFNEKIILKKQDGLDELEEHNDIS